LLARVLEIGCLDVSGDLAHEVAEVAVLDRVVGAEHLCGFLLPASPPQEQHEAVEQVNELVE
jgi:hypothetical protein